ncbi:MAG: HAMP domain-containing protein [Terriglobia bacterium]|jgi:nitrogen fixation/metabolism regulation signal transduction histidine kinase
MVWRSPRLFIVLLQGFSLRRRVALSLALVRLILVPVIFLAVYYLIAMASIVDRIVSVDAPVATNAERASIEMLDARRAEANYFLLHDPDDIARNRESLRQLEITIQTCRTLQPEEKPTIDDLEAQITFYRLSFSHAVERLGESNLPPIQSLREVVRTYQKDLDDVLVHSPRESRTRLIEMLRARIESFDAEVAAKVEENDPEIRHTSRDLATASQRILSLSTELESRSWQRVQMDHERARALLFRAEVIGGIVSLITLLVSIWVSFLLPRQVVKPLTDLKQAVDHAAAGNYEIEFNVKGDGEVVELADSVRNLLAHVREKQG